MTAAQMRAAGHTDLLAAISRRGGMSQWARRLGYGGRRERWDEQRIERELRQMLAGRRDWPTPREFRDAGRSELYWAVKRHGGAGLWAKRMGVSAPRRGRPPGR